MKKYRWIICALLAVLILSAVSQINEKNTWQREIEADCRELMDEYKAAMAEGDKTEADRAAAMYNDYIFSYASIWEGKVPHRLDSGE